MIFAAVVALIAFFVGFWPGQSLGLNDQNAFVVGLVFSIFAFIGVVVAMHRIDRKHFNSVPHASRAADLADAYYCSRDDVVFRKGSTVAMSPEQFKASLLRA